MKKRIGLLIVAFITSFVLVGCLNSYKSIRANLTIEFKNDSKANVSLMAAFKETSSETSDMSNSEWIKRLSEKGFEDWEYEFYEQEGFSGISMFKKDVEISDVVLLLEDLEKNDADNTFFSSLEKNGDNYVFDIHLYDKDHDISTSAVISFFKVLDDNDTEINYVVKLPYKVVSSNATSVSEDGKTLEWDLLSMEDSYIHVEFYTDLVRDLPSTEDLDIHVEFNTDFDLANQNIGQEDNDLFYTSQAFIIGILITVLFVTLISAFIIYNKRA